MVTRLPVERRTPRRLAVHVVVTMALVIAAAVVLSTAFGLALGKAVAYAAGLV